MLNSIAADLHVCPCCPPSHRALPLTALSGSNTHLFHQARGLGLQQLAKRWSSLQAYTDWLCHSAGTEELLNAQYDPDMRYAAILDERQDAKGRLQYLVRWHTCAVRCIHLPCLHRAGVIESAEPLSQARDPSIPSQALYTVTWSDSSEGADTVHEQPESAALFKHYMQRRVQMASTHRHDQGLSEEVQQGHPPSVERRQSGLSTRPDLTRLIDIDTSRTHHPNLDIDSTSKYCVCSEPGSTHCTVHLPCGRFVGRVILTRLHTLHTAYVSCDRPAGFEEALAQLLTRTKKCNNKAPIMWHVPREILVALRIGLSLDTELFTDPLTSDRGMRLYYSSDSQDSVFGANYDPYSTI